ncbi:MAG TPA: polysaccharide deacetylase [Tissierellia bacterium]|mgnify:CR=1 FL=1|nr:polysaccharide deacetylase [Tissierellia bacterium]
MQYVGKVVLPEGKKVAVNLGFDFDAFSVWMETFKQSSQAYMSRGEYGAEVGVPRILDLLKKYDIEASFCVPGHTADSYPDICKEIIKEGHEILHHGYVHEDPTFLPIEEEEKILVKGLEALEKLGVKPIGYRSPGFDLSPNTLNLLEKHGIKYDSSLMGNDFYPYHPRVCEVNYDKGNVFGEPLSIVEMPVTWYLDDFPHLEFIGTRTGMKPPSQVFEIWKMYFDYAVENTENGMMVVTMHPQVIGRPHNIIMLEQFINYVLERGGWITSLRNIYKSVEF